MSRGYRAFYRIHAGDDGRPLGKAGLVPVATNLQAHVAEAFADQVRQGYRGGRAFIAVRSRLGRPVLIVEVDEAWEVRVALPVIDRFLRATGWGYSRDLNANTRAAWLR